MTTPGPLDPRDVWDADAQWNGPGCRREVVGTCLVLVVAVLALWALKLAGALG